LYKPLVQAVPRTEKVSNLAIFKKYLQWVLAAKILTVDFVVCTLAVKKKIRAGFDMSDRTIPLSDHLPIIFHILARVKIKNLSEPAEKFHRLGIVSKSCLCFNIT
jgi:hypothetical protein